MPPPDTGPSLPDRAVALAQQWEQHAATAETDPAVTRMESVLGDPDGARFVRDIADEVLRPESLTAAAAALHRLAPQAPEALSKHLRSAVQIGGAAAPVLPAPIVPIVRRAVRELLSPLFIAAPPSKLSAAIERLRHPRLDLSLYGETVRGEAEAQRRLDGIHDLIRRDDVDHVTLAVSDIVSRISLWAFDEVVDEAVERLLPLYVSAAQAATFVTLEVREYRDLDLTIAVFTRVLEDPRLVLLRAGISLPCSLPDALAALRELTAWATHRFEHGGEPITVRLADSADAGGERAQARINGWTPAGYDTALDAAANLLRCLSDALHPDKTAAVKIALAAQDLGVIAYGWLLAGDRGVQGDLEFELVLGTSPGRVRAISQTVGPVLLSAPVVPLTAFDVNAAALVCRFPGETAPGQFVAAVERSTDSTLRLVPRRTQNRLAPVHESVRQVPAPAHPDADLTQTVLGISRGSAGTDDAFVETAVYSRRELAAGAAERIAGGGIFHRSIPSDPSLSANRSWARGLRTRFDDSTVAERSAPAVIEDAGRWGDVVEGVRAVAASWGSRSVAHRAETLLRAAGALEARRGELIEVVVSETAALFADADLDVSAAIDVARSGAANVRELDGIAGARFDPAKVTVVVGAASLAATAGAVLAALAAGSGVIVSAANGAAHSTAALVETLWQAGVPRGVLTLVDVDLPAGVLAAEPGVDRVLDAADRDRRNAVIITPSADLDLAVAEVVRGAFGRAGQSFGAASLVILVGQAGRSVRFARQLADAVRSLRIGWPSDPRAEVGPLPQPPHGALAWALSDLDGDEQWLVRPEPVEGDTTGRLWKPGVRVGVRAGSRFHLEAFAGPVLGIMYANTLTQAIELQNACSDAVTAGLHTREPDELDVWLRRAQADALFVNRRTVDALMPHRPRGTGVAARAGDANHLIGLGSWRSQPSGKASSTLHLRGLDTRISTLIEAAQPTLDFDAFEWVRRSALSDAIAWDREFGQVRDVARLGVERNLLRYRPVPVMVRASADAQWQELLRVIIAAIRSGSDFVLSTPVGLPAAVRQVLGELDVLVYVESDAQWVDRMTQAPTALEGVDAAPQPSRVRLIGSRAAVSEMGEALASAAGDQAVAAVDDEEVTSAGRIELLSFVREQSISITAHRHGASDAWTAAVI